MVLDAGDALLPMGALTTGSTPQSLAQASTIIRALGLMGLDAMAVGEIELAIGVAPLIKVAREAKVTLLCANLVDAQGKPPFEQRVLLQRAGIKIGVFAVLELPAEQNHQLLPLRQAKLEVTDTATAARAQIAALRQEGANVIVMIAHTGMTRARALAPLAPGAQVILVAHSGERHETPLHEGDTFLMEAGRRGRDLGHLQLRLGRAWNADQKLVDDSQRHALYREIMFEVQQIQDGMKKAGAPQSLTRYKFRVDRANKLALQLEQLAPPRAGHTLITTLLQLDETWVDQPKVKALVDANKATWAMSSRSLPQRPGIKQKRSLLNRTLRPHTAVVP